MNARDAVLGAVRAALAGQAPPTPADIHYRRRGDLAPAAAVDRFLSQIDDYNVHITRLGSEAEIASAVARRMAELGALSLVVPDDLPPGWRPAGVSVVEDGPQSRLELSALNAVASALTGCVLAIAETGTVVLDGGARQGRRALTLLPDHHLCVVFADQVRESVPEALQALLQSAAAGRPLTFFSGPSATADIEFDRVVGVHGPRRLDVLFIQN